MVRQVLMTFILIIFALTAAGCAERMVCSPPNTLIGNTCCLDIDSDNVCDAPVEEEPEVVLAEPEEQETDPEQEKIDAFAETFASTWNRKSYTALHKLFVKDTRMRISSQEFNFLARRIDSDLGIEQVSLLGVDGDVATYELTFPDQTILVSGDLDKEGEGYVHDAFYFFDDVSADAACGSDAECFMDFALISGDRNYCDNAGEFKADCVAEFGVTNDITEKIDDCVAITEYYGRAECLTRTAVNENDIEPCWQAGQDKQMFECMGEVAAARKDVDECPDFVAAKGLSGTRLQVTYCILGYVRVTTDTTACAKIDRRDDVMLGAMQEGCYKLSFP